MSDVTLKMLLLGEDRSAGKALHGVGAEAEKSRGHLSTFAKTAAGVFAGAALLSGAKAVGGALVGMTKNAMEDEAAQKRLATSLKNTAGATDGQVASVENWISKQGVALGVTDDELRPALGRLVTATHDVGKAQKLTSLAMDVSAGTGKSLESVTTALMKAQNGSVGGLSKLGVATKDAAGHTMSLKEITKQMADTYKGQAATAAGTAEGKFKRLKVIFDETKESIGAKLIPVAMALATWFLTKGLPAAQAFGGWLHDKLGPIFKRIGDVVRSVTAGMDGDVGKNLGAVVDTIRSIVSIIKSLWARFGDFITEYVIRSFQNARQYIGGALRIIQGIFKVFSSLLKGDWRGVWEGIKLILSGALDVIKGLVKQALNILQLLFRVGWSIIKGIVAGVWSGIKALVAAGADWVVAQIRALPGKIAALAGRFRDAGVHLIGAMVDGLKNAGGVVSGIAGNVWDAVRGMLNSAIGKINSALSFHISLPGPDINVSSHIPYLAAGGIVTRPTLAMIGEAGPEAVVPLGRGAGFGGGGDQMLTVNLTLDGKTVQQVLLNLKRSKGGVALGLA